MSLMLSPASLLRPTGLTVCRALISTSCGPVLARRGRTSAEDPPAASPPDPRLWRNEGNPLHDPLGPLSDNDRVATHVRNRNPMNLERMRIARKPSGFSVERRDREYWNRLDLSITQQHTTAEVTHWTGRRVCWASTREWALQRFLYNNIDAAAVQAVGRVVGQRCLETGVREVHLKVEAEDMEKERMRKFVEAVRESGLVIGEGPEYRQENPHRRLSNWKPSLKAWEYTDE